MSKLVYSSEKLGCGATIELDSGGVCMISIAQSGVLVRSYKKGFWGTALGSFFGPILYRERNVYGYLEVRCLGCDTHQTVALDVVRRPKTTPIHELERYMRCRDCSQVRGYAYKRSHLVALRPTKISVSDPPSISVSDPPSTVWPGER